MTGNYPGNVAKYAFGTLRERLQRNHIACAMLVWRLLKNLAYKTGETVYKIKHNLLYNYLIEQLKRPSVAMFIA